MFTCFKKITCHVIAKQFKDTNGLFEHYTYKKVVEFLAKQT